MPRYQYECAQCKKVLTLSHLSNEQMVDCPDCLGEKTLKKLLTTFRSTSKKQQARKKVGAITEEFIESSRADLQQQKEELENIK